MSANAYHFERALFVVGERNSGKSVQLRSLFRDFRLGTDGSIPAKVNLPEMYRLSNERLLYIRLSSPHESGESVSDDGHENFLDKTHQKFLDRCYYARRWNFAGALQPTAHNHMPDASSSVRAFAERFNPERIRVAFLSPDKDGVFLQKKYDALVAPLRAIPSVEICWIDSRDRRSNGLLLADFFDFM